MHEGGELLPVDKSVYAGAPLSGSAQTRKDAFLDRMIVAALIEAGADINARNTKGETPLALALHMPGDQENADLLRKHGGVE